MMQPLHVLLISIFMLLTIIVSFKANASPFNTSAMHLTALEGTDIVIPCVINDIDGTVFWQKGSSIISSARHVFSPTLSGRVSVIGTGNSFDLLITKVKADDEGTYSCQIAGGATLFHSLTVIVRPSISFYPDTETELLQEGNELVLNCSVSGKPTPSITWTFNGSQGSQDITEKANQTVLRIENVKESDAGFYSCRADNIANISKKHTIKVVVEFAPRVVLSSPVAYAEPGQNVSIECQFFANPEVVVEWQHNNSRIDFSHWTNMNEGHRRSGDAVVWIVNIKNLESEQLGPYTCSGNNAIGMASDVVTLSPYPHDLKILSGRQSRYTDRYVLRWNARSHSQVMEFTIALKQLNESFDTEWQNFSVPTLAHDENPSNSHEYILSQLAVNTSYMVLVKVRNRYGYSNWSESFTFHTALEEIYGPLLSTKKLEPPTISKVYLPVTVSGGFSTQPTRLFIIYAASLLLLRNC